MDRTLALFRDNNFYFDDVFSQMDRKIARLHHDMRKAMFRLAPSDLMSTTSKQLESQLAKLRDVFSTAEDGSRQLDVTLDMSSFKPEEIEVKVKDNVLSVKAKHEEKNEHSFMKTEFHRQFTLPQGTDVNQIKTSLTKDGVLAIKGPVPEEGAKGKTIPITHK